MSTTARATPTSHVIVREGSDGTPYYEVKWTSRVQRGKQKKRRLGPAWLERGDDGWTKRRGRPPEGWLDHRRAVVRADEVVREVEASLTAEAQERAAREARPLTFREVAHEMLDDMRTVARVKPSTLQDYGFLLREPGEVRRRGRPSEGRIMAAFGDRDVRAITPKEVGNFLRALDKTMTPRNVNKYRQVLSVVFSYACREDTHGVESNPVERVPKRKEPQPGGLDYYEVEEVEQLARALADGKHRKPPTSSLSTGELLDRAWEDARDADFIRVLFFTGMRLSELRALRWRDVDLQGRVILIRRNVSAGVLVETPKGGKPRPVPLAARAVEVLRRQSMRPDFTGPDDLVFGNRFGAMLDDSALRRRYTAACKAIGLRRVRLHGLRHAAGSHVARQAQAVEVRDFLGHSKLSTTDRYVGARFSPEFLERLDAAFSSDEDE